MDLFLRENKMAIQATEEEMRFIDTELHYHKQSGGSIEVNIIPKDEDSIDTLGYEATTLLHLAAKCDNAVATKYLIDNGYNINITNPSGCTPLMLAMNLNNNDIVVILLEADADIFLRNHSGVCAAQLGLQTLQNFADLIAVKLKIICGNSSEAIAMKLLELECSLKTSTIFRDVSIVKYMLNNGRAVDEPDPNHSNLTALHYAVLYADVEIVKLLLERGINPNVTDSDGETPLFYYNVACADTDAKLEVLKIMLSKGASLTISCDSMTVHDFLCTLGRKDTIRIIVEYNENLLKKGKEGLPLLKSLVINKNAEVIDIFQSRNWDFNTLDQPDSLVFITIHGNPEILDYLLRKRVDMDATHVDCKVLNMLSLRTLNEWHKHSPARTRNYFKCVERLLYHGADTQHIVRERITIFQGIQEYKNFALAKIILAHLALTEEIGKPIKELIIFNINADVRFKKYFDQCKRRLEKMKKTVIYKSITLFRFLTEDENRIVRYARNQDLMEKLKFFMYQKRNSKMYYDNILRDRLKYSSKMAKLEDHAVEVLLEIGELKNNKFVAHMIVDYLNYFDLLRFA